jgi:amino acid adenylation domain-containing protein
MHAAITHDTVDFASDADIARRLLAGDGPRVVRESRQTLDRLIARRAETHPHSIAVIDGGAETSYRTLVDRSANIAAALRARGVVRGARVGLCADASVELFASILAIWSIGATYVALDTSLPTARMEHIARDAALGVILVTRATGALIDPSVAVVIDTIESDAPARFASDARTSDDAYIVYTSGSTGVPKGVAIRHDALTNAILAAAEAWSIDERDRQLCRTSIAFDVAFLEIFAPLAAGGTLVIAPRTVWADPRAFIALLIANAVTSIVLVPSFLAVLVDERSFSDCSSLRIVVCGGEAMSTGLCRRFFAASAAELYNGYGPSEATIFVTSYRCRPADAESIEETVALGSALANTHVSVRDADLMPVAPGSTGEIVIGGVQLANGYINRPEETAARFVPDPLRPNQRLYRTGDLARLGTDGSIVFLGRNDKQVKIRGQRVEPGEVAAAIERIDGVGKAAVIAQRRSTAGPHGALILVAYVVERTGAALDPATLRRTLREQLPDAMVPAEIVLIDAFPLAISGKIDEAALAQRDDVSMRRIVRMAAPKDDSSLREILHEQLRTIWEDLLGLDGIGNDDDFFDLGGDSMLAVTLMMRLEETFGAHPSFADFFETMTIAGLGELLSGGIETHERDAVTFNEAGSLPPLVFLHGDFGGGMYTRSLAAALGKDQPLLVIPPHGIAGRPPVTDVETMAADVAAIVARFHPSGPLRIAGYSAAGYVAYEAARQLQRAGRNVLDVVVIGMGAETVAFSGLDTFARRVGLPRAWHNIALRGAMRVGFGLTKGFRTAPEQPVKSDVRATIERGSAFVRYVRAHRVHIPRRYDGRVMVLWPKEQPIEYGDIRREWSRVAPRVEVAFVPGTHHSAVSRHIGEIASAMRRLFAREYGTVHYLFPEAARPGRISERESSPAIR